MLSTATLLPMFPYLQAQVEALPLCVELQEKIFRELAGMKFNETQNNKGHIMTEAYVTYMMWREPFEGKMLARKLHEVIYIKQEGVVNRMKRFYEYRWNYRSGFLRIQLDVESDEEY